MEVIVFLTTLAVGVLIVLYSESKNKTDDE
jgi:hypothetical protein